MIRWMTFASCVSVLCLSGVPPALAEYYSGDFEEVPIERLLENLQRKLEANPKEAQAHYLVARVHSMAFASDRTRFRVNPDTGAPRFDDGASGVFIPPRAPAAPPPPRTEEDEARREHLQAAIGHFRRAVELEPHHRAAQVGLGWSLLKAGRTEPALGVLRPAFEKAWKDEKDAVGAEAGRSLTVELGRYLLQLLDPRDDAAEIRRIRRRIRTIEAKPKWVTPILIPLGDRTALEALTTDAPVVKFDLDGTEAPRRWQWITPEAAWLVHDPLGRGDITSGRQLFGAVTFWIFWSDGYEALRALDDDADGMLRGEELRGLALWRDANMNGVSEPGEVRPLEAWGVTALACAGVQVGNTASWQQRGVWFEDGRVVPTYDWSPMGVPLESSR